MGLPRARVYWIALGIALGGTVFALHGQSIDERHVIIENLGLPAIDQGLLADESHAPNTLETRRRAAMRAAVTAQAHPPSAAFTPRCVIVKFKDTASSAERIAAMRAVSSSATVETRPSYADF